ncbi:MAG: IS1380 family transposase [Dermatophilaceae bacterium]
MKRIRRRGRVGKRVRIGVADPSLTATSGVAAIAELVDKLDVVGIFDRGIGSIKRRNRGASAGELLVGLAQSQLLGGDALVGLDRQRADLAAVELSVVPVLASTTAAGLARRFGPDRLAGVHSAIAALTANAYRLLPAKRRAVLDAAVTIDMDSTEVEVYGSTKQGVAYNYAGQRAGRPHLATWAEAGLSMAAELLAGNEDVRPRAAALLGRALGGIPEPARAAAAGQDRLRMRADAGYFTAELACAAVEHGCDFAIAAKRNTAMWRAYAGVAARAWADAQDMPGAQVAAVDYAPAGWPEASYTIIRRVRIDAEAISADPRSRRRRTIDPDQLALALEGTATHAYAVSFIVTNIPTHDQVDHGEQPGEHGEQPDPCEQGQQGEQPDPCEQGQTVRDVEAWFRRRTDIEERIREAKLGAGLRHLPSAHTAINAVWMWAALLAGNLSVLLQALTGIDEHGRAHAARLRHELLCVPARLVRHGRRLTLRLPPGQHLLSSVLAKIRQLDSAA